MSYHTTGSRASSVRPLLAGDSIDGHTVRGFAWTKTTPGRQRSDHHDDRLLLDGDEALAAPPPRPVPLSCDGAMVVASMPPDDLDADRVVQAAAVDPGIARRVDNLLDLPSAVWQPVSRMLFGAVHATGHRAWLAGGAVRDVVSGVPPREVKDLDMSGTMPPGRFCDAAYQALRAAGMSEYRIKVSSNSLVCSIVAPGSTTRLIEYRGLSLGGYPYPAVGSRLAEDAQHRDYAFNALLYDVLEHLIFDPSGRGLRDLLGAKRCFHPQSSTEDIFKRADMIVRAMKFALRWAEAVQLDLRPMHVWLKTLPEQGWDSLTESQWESLRRKQREIPQAVAAQQRFAATLPPAGRGLLTSLIGGA